MEPSASPGRDTSFVQGASPVPESVLRAPELAAIKQRQQATWATGDYSVVGTTLQIVGERLCESVDLRAGERVLDVAAGNGNASLAAARRWCSVTATDYVGALLERARERATGGAALHRVPRGRRRGAPLRRRQLRRGAVDLRRHVHAGPGPGGGRAGPRLPRRRAHRAGQLDARRLRRPAVQDHRQARAPATRPQAARPVGDGGPPEGAVRPPPREDGAPALPVPLPVARATGWRSSGPSTGRPTGPSPPWTRPGRRPCRPTCSSCWPA